MHQYCLHIWLVFHMPSVKPTCLTKVFHMYQSCLHIWPSLRTAYRNERDPSIAQFGDEVVSDVLAVIDTGSHFDSERHVQNWSHAADDVLKLCGLAHERATLSLQEYSFTLVSFAPASRSHIFLVSQHRTLGHSAVQPIRQHLSYWHTTFHWFSFSALHACQ